MNKKTKIFLVLLLLLVSVGAVSAADDTNDIISSNDNVSDVSFDLDVLTSDDVVNEDVLSYDSHTIADDNYYSYFNNKGNLISTSVKENDTLIISGELKDKNFIIQKSVNIMGADDVKLQNCMFTLSGGASGSSISNLNIYNTKETTYGIFLNGVSKCVIHDCFIRNTGASSYTICIANDANYNNVTNNVLQTYGITYGHGSRSTSPLIISGAHYNYIADNDIQCDDANGIYLSKFSGGPLKGGDSNFNIINNNTIKYNVLPTSWAYGIQVMGSNNTVTYNRVIGAYLGISGGINTTITDNWLINVTGADFNNVDVEIGGAGAISSSMGSIVRNNHIVNAKVSSTGAGISVSDRCVVENNDVEVLLTGVGIRPQGSNVVIQNNNISTVSGAGILNYKTQFFNLYVLNNKITSQSGVGILIQQVSSKKMPGNITIVNNTIFTNNQYAINAAEVDASMFYDIAVDQNIIINRSSKVKTPEGEYNSSKYYYSFKGKTFNITPDNFGEYIDENGGLSSNITDGDILFFKGEFSNKYIYLNKAIKLTGDNPIFYNTTFRVSSEGVWIEKLTIQNDHSERINAWGVLIYQVSGSTIVNCTISVYDPNAAYAIYVVESDQVDIINNTLSSEGNYLTYTILAHTVNDCNIINNTIFTNGTGVLYTFEPEHCLEGNTVCPDGDTVCPEGDSVCPDGNSVCPDGNSVAGSHVLKEVYRTYGILMVYSSDNIISKNKVRVTSKLNKNYSPFNSTNSIVGIDLYYNSHNNVFSQNEVYVWGNDNYQYGMGVLGYYTTMIAPEGQGAENNKFMDNKINVEGTYFATGIIIGSSSENTAVTGNTVHASSINVTYGITLEVSQKSIIKNNNVTLNSEIIYGLEAFDSNNNAIGGNIFNIVAKQAYGFVMSNSRDNEINSNKIILEINDDGFSIKNMSTKNFDTIVGGNAGLYFRSYATGNSIEDNNITTSKGYAIIIDEDAIDNLILNNYLFSANGTGNGAVNSTANNTVKDNYVHLVSGNLLDVDIKYMENGTFKFVTEDINLNGAKVEFIDDYGEIINTTIISNGEAIFEYDFDGFIKHGPARYVFYAKVYKENYKSTLFNCYLDISPGDLLVSVNNVTGVVARNTQYVAIVKNILGKGVSGISVEFYVIDEGFKVYVGKAISDSEGLATLVAEIPKIYDENPVVFADIVDPYNFNPTSAQANVIAYWLTDTMIVINSNIYSGGNLATLKDNKGNILSNKSVSIMIDGNILNAVTDSRGMVKIPVIAKGSHDITVTFGGDENYYESKIGSKINVLSSIVENKDSSVYYGNVINYKVRVRGSDGSFGAGNIVLIKINGNAYKVSTDKNGYATKVLKLKTGFYTITAEFNGDKVVNKLTFKPTLVAKNIIKKKAKKIKFSVKVVNKNGKAVKKKKVTFKIKGKKYTAKTNKKGVATVSLKNLKVGKFIITSSYGGCTIKNTIKIKK